VNKTVSINIFNTPTHRIEGITNIVTLLPKQKQEKLYALFLEYDLVSKHSLLKYLEKLGDCVEYTNAYVYQSRPPQKNRWHVIIPEVFTTGEWLQALMESNCDQSYKSMSIKRQYSVLRAGKKANNPKPEFAFIYQYEEKNKRLISLWHSLYVEKTTDASVKGRKVCCASKVIGYTTGHF
jgi:hypothetical protein